MYRLGMGDPAAAVAVVPPVAVVPACPRVALSPNNPNGYQFPDANGVCVPVDHSTEGHLGFSPGDVIRVLPMWGWGLLAAGAAFLMFGGKR